jgi:hypothetical protein
VTQGSPQRDGRAGAAWGRRDNVSAWGEETKSGGTVRREETKMVARLE